jgi:hypothetical protein
MIIVGLLAGCGLEPRYVVLPTPVSDGRAVWVVVGTAPPSSAYAPVLIGEPTVGVCRAVLTISQSGPEEGATGYMVGELGQDGACRVVEGGATSVFPDRFEQLYIRAGVVSTWVTRDELRPDRMYQDSKLWANNAIPITPMRRPDGTLSLAWLPCAAEVAGRWRVGMIGLHEQVESAFCATCGWRSRPVADSVHRRFGTISSVSTMKPARWLM